MSSPAPRSSSALSPEQAVIALHRDGRLLRLVRLGGGTMETGTLPGVSEEELRAFRRRLRLPFVAAVDVDALPLIWAEVQAAMCPEEDWVAQWLAAAKVARGHLGRGIRVDPRPVGNVPLPSYAALQVMLDRLLPDGSSFVFYLVDGGQPWTSLIAAKEGGDIRLVTTHAAISDMAPLSSIRGDAPRVVRAIAQRIAPPHVAIFLPLRVWHEVLAGDLSAIARALANRQAVLDPAPPWLLALVGAGAMAEAATRSARLAGRLFSASKIGARLLPGGAAAAERLVQTVTNPLEALGLDPWEMLRWGRDWARRLKLDRASLAASAPDAKPARDR